MKDDILENYQAAGALASRILREGAQGIRVGASYLDLVESIEARVKEEGAELAFPLNLSLNEDAAHDTASPGDERVFRKGDVAKLDLGVQVDGYIADTAVTVDLGNNSLLLDASREALEAAIRAIKPGVPAGALGAAIQQEIESRGYRPVANLTGHGLGRFLLHGPPTIHNTAIGGGVTLEADMVFAIEPFATTGSGRVGENPGWRSTRRSQTGPSASRQAAPFSTGSKNGTACLSPGAGLARRNSTSPSLRLCGRGPSMSTRSLPTSPVPLSPSTSIP